MPLSHVYSEITKLVCSCTTEQLEHFIGVCATGLFMNLQALYTNTNLTAFTFPMQQSSLANEANLCT